MIFLNFIKVKGIIKIILTIAVIAISFPAIAQRQTPEPPAAVETVEEVTVTVKDNYILITLSRPMEVKIFTILGQPITVVQLPAGTSRIKAPARGIYLLKAGSNTKRITV